MACDICHLVELNLSADDNVSCTDSGIHRGIWIGQNFLQRADRLLRQRV